MFPVFTVIYTRCKFCFCVAPHLPKRLQVFIFLNTKNNRHIWQYRPLQPRASRFSGIRILSADTLFCIFRQQSSLREALRAEDNINVIWTDVISFTAESLLWLRIYYSAIHDGMYPCWLVIC